MNIRPLLTALLTLAAFFILSCKDTVNDQNVNDIVFPASGVSYGKQVEPLFFRGCAFTSCHDAGDQAGGLSLETYQDLRTAVPSVVNSLRDTGCLLIWSVEGAHGFQRMPPPPFSALNANQINGLKQWVLEGAQNN